MVNHLTIGDQKFKGLGYYERLRQYKEGKESVATKQIELDLLRTFPSNKHFNDLNAEVGGSLVRHMLWCKLTDVWFDLKGLQQLRRVLVVYSWHNPQVGYCQGMNMLAATALLFLDEEMAFWLLVAIIEHILPLGYYTSGLIASQADQRVLKDLMAERLPRISQHLERHGIDLELVTFNWLVAKSASRVIVGGKMIEQRTLFIQ